MTGMGIVILFMVFVCAAVFGSFVISALVAFALIPLVYIIRKTPKERRLTGGKKTLIMLSLGVVLSVAIIGLGTIGGKALLSKSGGPVPVEEGRRLISLPPEAEVTKVDKGDWAGDFFVEFRLPDTRSPADWLDQVWSLNASKQKDFQDYQYRNEPNSVGIFCFGVAHMSITYDPATGIYRFEHYFES
jgi:hypothetical protein